MTTVLTNATVVTMDVRDSVLHGAAIAIDGDRITTIGATAEVLATTTGATVIDLEGAIVHPGLVNAHTHLAMTMFRGYADDLDLQGFLDRLLPAETRVLTGPNVRVGAELAFAESLRAGCTAALDMFWWPTETQRGAAELGFVLGAGPVFIGFPGPDGMNPAERVSWADSALDGAEFPWVMPHSTYTLDPAQLAEIAVLAERHRARVHVHASENQPEVDLVRGRYGRSPIEVLADTGLLHDRTVLAHAVALDEFDIDRIVASGAVVAHCPMSNLKLGSGICPVPDLVDAGVIVALGTDGCASSNDLDLYGAMRMAALVHKGVRRDANVLPAATVLRMATVNGAIALGRDHELGSIEVGKRADLVVLDPSSLALTPSYDPIGTIVYAATRADVASVWCAGRQIISQGRLNGYDTEPTRLAVLRLAREIAG
jgi:5-methylthioadenosine/S-adenosylhomocysteine deaminase